MTFKIQAQITMTKDLTIEAEGLTDALNKAQEMMQGEMDLNGFTASDMRYRVMSHAIGDSGLVETNGEGQ